MFAKINTRFEDVSVKKQFSGVLHVLIPNDKHVFEAFYVFQNEKRAFVLFYFA